MAQRPTKTAETSERDRALYIGQRVRELQAELKALRAESRQVRDSLRGLTNRQTPEAKALKARRAYTALRPDEAKAELERLTAERNAMRGKSAD
ncbi:MAG: hypothetical protein ACK4PG_06520 [Acetobacteraceae bacterium]